MEQQKIVRHQAPRNFARCIGKFAVPISWVFVRSEPMTTEKFVLNKRLFNNMIVIEADFKPWNDTVEYIAIGPMFSELPESEHCVPEYVVVIDKDGRAIFDYKKGVTCSSKSYQPQE